MSRRKKFVVKRRNQPKKKVKNGHVIEGLEGVPTLEEESTQSFGNTRLDFDILKTRLKSNRIKMEAELHRVHRQRKNMLKHGRSLGDIASKHTMTSQRRMLETQCQKTLLEKDRDIQRLKLKIKKLQDELHSSKLMLFRSRDMENLMKKEVQLKSKKIDIQQTTIENLRRLLRAAQMESEIVDASKLDKKQPIEMTSDQKARQKNGLDFHRLIIEELRKINTRMNGFERTLQSMIMSSPKSVNAFLRSSKNEEPSVVSSEPQIIESEIPKELHSTDHTKDQTRAYAKLGLNTGPITNIPMLFQTHDEKKEEKTVPLANKSNLHIDEVWKEMIGK